MASSAAATFSFKEFSGAPLALPGSTSVGIGVALKKKLDDTLLTLSFTDATFKSVRAAKGLVAAAEQKLGGAPAAALAGGRCRPPAGRRTRASAAHRSAPDPIIPAIPAVPLPRQAVSRRHSRTTWARAAAPPC